ncbi:MAG: GH3 auxin-responsive promoter family protein [Planctomyces sp.]|nr:GH3 auxin-responsive promoter family protein [Planctomyces sp.]
MPPRPIVSTQKYFARSAISAISAVRWPPFRRLLDRAAAQQTTWLLNRVRVCQETAFGRDHGFSEIRSLADFRKRVPIAKYDHFGPYIDRVAGGETSALVPDSEQLLRFTITTGSSGVPKLNPVTSTWLKEYRRGWDIWGLKLFADHPKWLGDQMLQLAGKWDMGTTPGGFSISMVSALLARIQNPLLRPYYAIPSPVNDIPDPIARYYTALRLSIVQRIGWIVLMNPGTLIMMAELGNEHRERLIRDVRDGSLSPDFDVPGPIREQLRRQISRRDPRRARELEQIVRATGTLLPKDYWDRPVIGCWLGGTAGFQQRFLPRYFGDCSLRDMGLVSSEGRHTIPIEDGKPEGVPSIVAGFYEFLPVEDAESPMPQALAGHELEPGRDYYLLMTTSGGFYRFNIGDVVRCQGFVGQAPLVEFLQKGERCGDLEGEKLTERQFLECAHAAAAELGIQLTEITAVPTRDAEGRPRYEVLVEQGDIPDRTRGEQFLTELETRLKGINFLYNARRREHVLLPARLRLLPRGAWSRHIREETDRRGTGDYQYKHPGLVQDAAWLGRFEIVDAVELSASSGE